MTNPYHCYVCHVTYWCALTDNGPLTPSDLCQVFTVIYTAEMVVKVVAMDPYNYFRVRLPVCHHLRELKMAANVLSLLLCCRGYR